MSIRLRKTRPDDEGFLLEVYASTRMAEMTLAPWSDQQKNAFVEMQFRAQDSYYRQRFPEAEYQLVLYNEEPVGRLYVSRERNLIHILDVAVLPRHRNQGIGSFVIRELMNEAGQSGKAVQIYVETFNPSVRLFERFGFSKIAEDGLNYLLEYHQPAA